MTGSGFSHRNNDRATLAITNLVVTSNYRHKKAGETRRPLTS